MSYQLGDIVNKVFFFLDEPTNSAIGALEPGDGTATIITTQAGIVESINRAQQVAARSVYFLNGTGTLAVVANTSVVDIMTATVTTIPATTGSKLWAARRVAWAGNPLTFTGFRTINQRRVYVPTTPATPAKWYNPDGSIVQVGFDPIPDANATATITGFCLPPALVSLTDPLTWLEVEEDVEIIWLMAILDICSKALEDPKLAMRRQDASAKFESRRRAMRQRLDQALVDKYMEPLPPVYTPRKQGTVTR